VAALATGKSAAIHHAEPLDSAALASSPATSPGAGDATRLAPRRSAKFLFASGFEEAAADETFVIFEIGFAPEFNAPSSRCGGRLTPAHTVGMHRQT
jgi:hypothetical protein